jgi:glycine cleavage system H protein
MANLSIRLQFVGRTFSSVVLQNSVSPRFVRQFSRASAVCSGRLYSDKHEWVQVEGTVGTVGISHYAQEALGDIVYAQLPDVGAELDQFGECGALESVKAASELYTPVSGKVIEKNTEAEETPSIINRHCHDKGWLFKLELKSVDELKQLMDEKAYQAFLKAQATEDH